MVRGYLLGLARLGLGYMRLVRGYLLGLARLGLGVLGELVGGYLLGLARLGLGYMRLVGGYLLRLARLRLGYMGLLWGRVLLSAHLALGFHVVGLLCQLTSHTHKAGARFLSRHRNRAPALPLSESP